MPVPLAVLVVLEQGQAVQWVSRESSTTGIKGGSTQTMVVTEMTAGQKPSPARRIKTLP